MRLSKGCPVRGLRCRWPSQPALPAPAWGRWGAVGARKPFEPDPGRTGVGTGTLRQKPPSSSRQSRIFVAQRRHHARFRATLIRKTDAEDRGASGHHWTVSIVAQGPCGRPASSRNRGRDARDRAGGGIRRARSPRLRHVGPLFRPICRNRHQQGPPGIAQAVDRGARRCRILPGPRGQARGQRVAPGRGERRLIVRSRPAPGVARQKRARR